MVNTKKISGYILSILGLLAIGLTFPEFSSLLNLNLPETLSTTTLTITGVLLLVVGVFLLKKSSKTTSKAKGTEVPIYQGSNVVGYRRH